MQQSMRLKITLRRATLIRLLLPHRLNRLSKRIYTINPTVTSIARTKAAPAMENKERRESPKKSNSSRSRVVAPVKSNRAQATPIRSPLAKVAKGNLKTSLCIRLRTTDRQSTRKSISTPKAAILSKIKITFWMSLTSLNSS